MLGEVALPAQRQARGVPLGAALALATGLLTVQAVLWLWPGGGSILAASREIMIPAESLLAAAALLYGAWRARTPSPRLSRAWAVLALAQGCTALADALWLVAGTGADTALPAAANGLHIAYYPLFLFGLLHFPHQRSGPGQRLKVALDVGVLLLGMILLIWSAFAGPLIAAGVHQPRSTVLLALAYPACDLVLLLATLTLLLRPIREQRSEPLVVLAAASLVLMLTHAYQVQRFLIGQPFTAGLPDLGRSFGYLVAGGAGVLQAALGPAAAPGTAGRPFRGSQLLPHAGLAAAVLLLIWNQNHPLAVSFQGLALGTICIVALIIGRQAALVRESDHLYEELKQGREELELRVCERTADLEQINRDLQDEMHSNAQLFVSLHDANQQLRAAVTAKDEMIQNVSHELRTPLMLILGYMELLHNSELGELSDEQADAVETVLRQGERLRFMVNRLLTMQTFEPGKLRPAPIDVAAWLKESVDAWQVRAAQTGVCLSLEAKDALPEVVGDRDFLGQVLENLLDNAVKFTPAKGTVRVRALTKGRDLIVAVADDGVGVPVDRIDQIFERFYQVDGSSNRRFGGMGIGLALCRAIVSAHNGRIWAESLGENTGTTFYVALPLDGAGR